MPGIVVSCTNGQSRRLCFLFSLALRESPRVCRARQPRQREGEREERGTWACVRVWCFVRVCAPLPAARANREREKRRDKAVHVRSSSVSIPGRAPLCSMNRMHGVVCHCKLLPFDQRPVVSVCDEIVVVAKCSRWIGLSFTYTRTFVTWIGSVALIFWAVLRHAVLITIRAGIRHVERNPVSHVKVARHFVWTVTVSYSVDHVVALGARVSPPEHPAPTIGHVPHER